MSKISENEPVRFGVIKGERKGNRNGQKEVFNNDQQKQVKEKLEEYLKSHNIHYHEDVDNGAVRLSMIYQGYEKCPDGILESCIWFYDKEMEVRVYYDENASGWCEKSEHLGELMRLFNFVSARLWPSGTDGANGRLYEGQYLFTPRLYMTEDGFHDITLTTMIPYDFYEIAPLEAADYITAACPELMDRLSVPIFLLLLGEMNLDDAINLIKKDVLEEK